jgi:hypothetical protein
LAKLVTVITTIQQPTTAVESIVQICQSIESPVIVIGDEKGPHSYDLAGAEFFGLQRQLESRFELARKLPVGHYSRKNFGYLEAISHRADCIYETDDDNAPLPSWNTRNQFVEACEIGTAVAKAQPNWVNVYKHFTDANIWPRGLPLDQIHTPLANPGQPEKTWAPIQQGLANGAPDVDAVWRLVMDTEFSFQERSSVMVQPGQWCPFNTQSTWWWPEVFPLLYIPSHCSFRMCDIWKSFVAQRCLWELDTGVVFHAPEVYQERNPHNLMRDFRDELVGYEKNDSIASILQSLRLEPGKESVKQNLITCYAALIEENIFPEEELTLLQAWISDLEQIEKRRDE